MDDDGQDAFRNLSELIAQITRNNPGIQDSVNLLNRMVAPIQEQNAHLIARMAPMAELNEQVSRALKPALQGLALWRASVADVNQLRELNRIVSAGLSGVIEAPVVLQADIEIVLDDTEAVLDTASADGAASQAEPAPAAPSRRRPDAKELALIFAALYSFVNDAAQNDFAEGARNTTWSIALILLLLMIQGRSDGSA